MMRFSSFLGSPSRARPFVPREVFLAGGVAPDQQVGPILLIQEGLLVGSSTVEGIKIKAGRAEVDEGIGVVLTGEDRGRVERQVMVDELPEVREARGDVGVVEAVLLPRLGWGLHHLRRQILEGLVGRQEGSQAGKEPSEAPLERRGAGDRVEASKGFPMGRWHAAAWGHIFKMPA
jgi:hypothetical protein